ncbi:MAG: maleylacetoacetate isomerase [Bdellovibrionales bacterium]|nr:maleylacetoacetate isomerase [Bdellovibrionales bacterium]
MSQAISLELYSYFRSSAAFRVRIALNIKKLHYTYRSVHLLQDGGQQYQPNYQVKNPMAEVPTLSVLSQGKSLNIAQSMAIIQFLEETFPNPALFPKSTWEKAQVIELCEIINSGIHPLQNLKVLQKLSSQFGADSIAKDTWVQHWIERGFTSLEKKLEQVSGVYSFGNELSAADLYLVPQTYTAKRFHFDFSGFPLISKISKNCLSHPEFIQADPFHQPDTPPSP